MTKYYSNQVAVYFGGYDLGTSTRRYAIGLNAEPLDPTALGDGAERVLTGRRKDSFEWDGLFDDTGAADAAGSALIGSGTQNVLMVLIGSAAGGVGYAGTALMVSAKPAGKLGELVTQGAEWRMDQSWDRGVHFGTKFTYSNPGTSASGSADNGAASTAGGAAYIVIISASGSGTSLPVTTIQDSADGTSFADLGTARITGTVADSQKFTITGTIKQYVRLGVYASAGTGTVTTQAIAVLKRS